ncbi:MAG: hypothetical protein MJ104_07360 [Lachnospiraceae bacterium]|nr:hypothetical protein [Lachnospiraceae bacterium]
MGLFKSADERQMDAVMMKIDMNMSNNYKDNAQMDLKDFEELFEEVKAKGKLSPKKLAKYEERLGDYQARLKGYTHKDQKPYWT